MEYYDPELETPEEYISRIEKLIGYRPATMSSILTKTLPFSNRIQAHRIVMMSSIAKQFIHINGEEEPYLIPPESFHLPELPGLHLRTAFMLWHGWNLEDAAVISSSAASRMSTMVKKVEKLQCLSEPDIKVDTGDVVRKGNVLATWKLEPDQVNIGYPTRDETNLFTCTQPSPGTITNVEKYTEMRGNTTIWNVRVTIEMKYSLTVGSKISNLHASKSIVSIIVPDKYMPYNRYGPVELLVSPYAIARRMAPSTIMEIMMNTLAKELSNKWGRSRLITNPDIGYDEVASMIESYNLPGDCMYQLYDGRTGMPYPNMTLVGPVFVGRLWHHAEDKIRFRDEVSEDYHGIPRKGTGAQSIKREELEVIIQHQAHGMVEECKELQLRSNTRNRINDLLRCIGIDKEDANAS